MLIALLLGFFNIFLVRETILAQSELANPLKTEIDQSDVLIPSGYDQRELFSLEKYRIEQTINKLAQTLFPTIPSR